MDTVEEINRRVKNLPEDLQEELLTILKSWQTGKERTYPRLDTLMEIDVLVGDRVIQTNMKNISATGVLVSTRNPVKTKETVKVVFRLAGDAKPLKLEGTVVRSDENGLAVEFEKITPYFKEILDEAIWRRKDNTTR